MSFGCIRPVRRLSKRLTPNRDPSSLEASVAIAERRMTNDAQHLFIEHLTGDSSDPDKGVTERGKTLPTPPKIYFSKGTTSASESPCMVSRSFDDSSGTA